MNEINRELLVRFLRGETHMSFESAVKDFPMNRINEFPPNVSYTPWHLLEHIRITQNDILNFIQNPKYVELSWPGDYWPPQAEKADAHTWQETIESYHNDLEVLIKMTLELTTDLQMRIPWGTGQTVVEEIMKVFDHTSYHLGEFGILRQVMNTWPKTRIP